jgi:hypothetical protein
MAVGIRPSSVHDDTGEAPDLELPPLRPRAERVAAEAVAAPVAQDMASALAQAFALALGQTQQQPVFRPRFPTDRTEVPMIANRAFHVDPAHLALSKIEGSAFGMDGSSVLLRDGEVFLLRPGPWVESLVAKGYASHYGDGKRDERREAAERIKGLEDEIKRLRAAR